MHRTRCVPVEQVLYELEFEHFSHESMSAVAGQGMESPLWLADSVHGAGRVEVVIEKAGISNVSLLRFIEPTS